MFNFLKSFRLVYETRSFSLAAAQLFVTQPTISNQIKQLEVQLKTHLFCRKGNQDVVPTPAAKILYDSSTKLLSQWQTTEQKLVNANKNLPLKLKIGVSQTIAQTFLPKLLKDLHRFDSAISLEVSISNSEAVLTHLNSHEIVFGLVEKPVISDILERVPIATDEMVCIGTPTDTWLSREKESAIYEYAQQYLLEAGISPKKIIQVDDINLLIKLVEQGLGQTVISKKMAPTDLPITFLGPHFNRHFYLLYSKADYLLNTQIKNVADTIQKFAINYL